MNQGKRKLRRRSTVFGRSKDDSFRVTSKARRKGQNSQNRWVNDIEVTFCEDMLSLSTE